MRRRITARTSSGIRQVGSAFSGPGPFREIVGVDGADQFAEEERVAACDRMQSRGE